MVRCPACRSATGTAEVRRLLRDSHIFGSFAQEAAHQRLLPDDVLRQLMLAYVAARTHHDPVTHAAWHVAHPPRR